jgi:hypothetical protein
MTHSPPWPSMHAHKMATASSVETTRPQVTSKPRTDSLSVGSAVFIRARAASSAYSEVTIGDVTVETKVGAGSVFVKKVCITCIASIDEYITDSFVEGKGISTGLCNNERRMLDTRAWCRELLSAVIMRESENDAART